MTETMRTILVLFAMLLGICANFLFPYVRKLILEGKIDQIDLKYVVHLIITACWQFLFGFAVYSQWQPPSGIINEALLYILAFAFGFGGSELQKEVGKLLNAFRTNPVGAIAEIVTPLAPTSLTESTPLVETEVADPIDTAVPEVADPIKPEDIVI